MINYFIRVLGVIVGILSIAFGVFWISVSDTWLHSYFNLISAILMGIVFVYYGVTGKNLFKEIISAVTRKT